MIYTIYIKTTNACNLRCKHCYNKIMGNAEFMDSEVLDSAVDAVSHFAETHPSDHIDVQFHGGEPMLYDIDALIRASDILSSVSNIRQCVTTNLVYELTGLKTDFFRRMKPDGIVPAIMTSWDFNIRFGCGQEKIWQDNVRALIQDGIDVRPIVCVTKDLIEGVVPNDIVQKFKELGISTMNFERITETGAAVGSCVRPKNSEVDAYLCEAYRVTKQSNMNVVLFDQVDQSVRGFHLGCRARRCMATVITVNPDGSLAACPNTGDRRIGKITDGTFEFNAETRQTACHKETQRGIACYTCEFFRYCNGDCCQLSFDETGCPGLKSIYASIFAEKR